MWDENKACFEKLVNDLLGFIYLKHLEIRLCESMTVSDIESVMTKKFYPSITLIAFNTVFSANHLQLSDDIISNESTSYRLKVDSIHPYPNIKRFKGSAMALTDDTIRYFIHKFPNLDKLVLEECRFEFVHLLPKIVVSTEMMGKFFNFISKIKSLDLYFTFTGDLLAVLSAYLQVTSTKVKISYVDQSGYITPQQHLRICKQASLYRENPYHHRNDGTERSDGIEVTFPVFTFEDIIREETLPHLNLIAEVGDQIQELELTQITAITNLTRDNKSEREVYIARMTENIKTIMELNSCRINRDALFILSTQFIALKNLVLIAPIEDYRAPCYIELHEFSCSNT